MSSHVILDILRPRYVYFHSRMPNLVLLEEVGHEIDNELKREMILLRNFGFEVSYMTGRDLMN